MYNIVHIDVLKYWSIQPHSCKSV